MVDQDEIEEVVEHKAGVHWRNHEKGMFSEEEAKRREENIRDDVDPTDELSRLFRGYGKLYVGIAAVATVGLFVLFACFGFDRDLLTIYGLGLDVLGAGILTRSYFSTQRGFQFSVGQMGGGSDANQFLDKMAETWRREVVNGVYGVSFLLIGFSIQGLVEIIEFLTT
ncbi:hypothetical protein [Halomontanus rarus]|uniref:hypothetical protein n=1 Tax=Halomontanus rarus TaxID=3034020 RepID=UPI001A97E3B2